MKALLLISLFFVRYLVAAETSLTLKDFLTQVKQTNQSVKGSLEASHAAHERSAEAGLLFAPNLFANAQLQGDSKLPQLPIFTYDELTTDVYQLGVSQLTSFGLQARLYYELDYTSFTNAIIPGVPPGSAAFPLSFYDARPVLELSESIWGNGFGKTARAQRELTLAQSAADEAASHFQARSQLVEAESTYWKLAVARESVSISQQALEEAKKINDYTSRRARMHLGESADELQSRAAWELAKLQLKEAEDEERTAARALNAIRNVRSNQVPEKITSLQDPTLLDLAAPARAPLREDVLAAREQQRATAANSDLLVEKDTPTLDVFGSYALNGRDTTPGGALGDPYSAGRPTRMVGLKLQIPLEINTASEARRGAIHQRDAAEMVYQQKLLDQETNWDDLTEKLEEAKGRLELSRTIEKAQSAKLENERGRLKNGRTTTYQVLLFEQDFLAAQLTRLRAQADVLGILTQMKLFSAGQI